MVEYIILQLCMLVFQLHTFIRLPTKPTGFDSHAFGKALGKCLELKIKTLHVNGGTLCLSLSELANQIPLLLIEGSGNSVRLPIGQ